MFDFRELNQFHQTAVMHQLIHIIRNRVNLLRWSDVEKVNDFICKLIVVYDEVETRIFNNNIVEQNDEMWRRIDRLN
jgi:hypothetical protein